MHNSTASRGALSGTCRKYGVAELAAQLAAVRTNASTSSTNSKIDASENYQILASRLKKKKKKASSYLIYGDGRMRAAR